LTNDGLVALRPAGGAAGNQLVPDLAVAMPVISDGGTTYTFRVRRGIHYSNGQPVRPSDFRFAVERQFLNPVSYGPGTAFPDLRGYSDPYCQKLATAQQQGTPLTPAVHQKAVERCRAVIDAGIVPNDKAGTITIHLQHSDSGFLYRLTSTFADMLPSTGTPAIDSGKPVPASGPYVISHAGANRIILVRNPRFHVWSAAQPAGFADRITFAYQANPAHALTEIEHGQADVMLDPPPANKSAELRTRYATLVHPYAALETSYVAFNTRVAPFSDVRARQAVNFAIDRRQFAMLAGGTQDNAPPTCQVLPPTMFGYRAYCPYTTHPNPTTGAWHGPNLTAALALVRASGTRGDTVDLRTFGSGLSRQQIQYTAGLLKRLGYNVNTHAFPNTSAGYGAYAQATSNSRLPLVVIEGWISDFPYPSDFFDPLLVCGTGTEPGIKFCDPHLDSLVRTAEAAHGTEALKIWEAADKEAVNQAPWAPLITQTGTDVVSRRVGNYQRNPQYGEILDQMWVR
jgi:peptide/nickel transport system substrate-binding protein